MCPDLHRSQEDLCLFILDDSYGLSDIDGSDVGWDSTEGLLGGADRKTAESSMSGYGNQPAIDYTTSQALQLDNHGFVYGETRSRSNTQGFMAYEQQGHAGAPTQCLPGEYDHSQYQLAYSTNTSYHPPSLYGVTQTAVPESNLQRSLVVTSWGPEQGHQGTLINVGLQSNYDLALLSTAKPTLSFANNDCPAMLKRLDDPRKFPYQYVLVSEVPMLNTAGSSSSRVLVSVQLRNTSGMTVNTIDVGYFHYNSQHGPGTGSPQGMIRQRSSFINMAKTYDPAANRAVAQPRSQNSTPGHYRTGSSPYAQRSRPHTHESSPRYLPYEMPSNRSRRRSSTISSESGYPIMDLTPQEPGWKSSYATDSSYGSRTAMSVTPALQMQSTLVPSINFEPPLFRTSQRLKNLNDIKDKNEGRSKMTPKITKVPHSVDARLEIHGNVDSMMDGWTADECKAKRRLVYLWRSQKDNIVHTSFAAWVPEARVPKAECTSCIWWEEEQDYYATSVDVIKICEQLVGGKLEIQEKNCIRRNISNIDKVDPTSIYKDDPKTGAFFSLVMGYTDPKPKNIQKTIKVFPWRIIAPALEKLVSKYGTVTDDYAELKSADYSSAPHLLCSIGRPKSEAYGPTSQPTNYLLKNGFLDTSNKDSFPRSPHSTSNSAHSHSISSTYSASSGSFTSSTASPNIPPAAFTSPTSYTMPVRTLATPTAVPQEYANYASYPQSDSLDDDQNPSHIIMAAGQQVRGSWNFSNLANNQDAYDVEAEERVPIGRHHGGSYR
ncbi:MAG: hypothetical protein Q9224_003911 [Gallowayella concinna]